MEQFKRDKVKGDCCFICGANPEDCEFNNEHIIPDWILRRFELQDRILILPKELLLNIVNIESTVV